MAYVEADHWFFAAYFTYFGHGNISFEFVDGPEPARPGEAELFPKEDIYFFHVF